MLTGVLSDNYSIDTIEWVKPTLPTVLGDLKRLGLAPTDLSFACLQQAIIFPGPLDKSKFIASFAHALSQFGHSSGRLRCIDGQWCIELANSAVPMIFGTSQLELTESMLEYPHPHVTQGLAMGFEPGECDGPLVQAVVTEWPKTGETSFGLSFSHVLGDGACVIRFVVTMSQFYTNRPPYPVPTFEKFLNPEEPELERTLLQEMLAEVPHLAIDYPPEVFHKLYNEMMEETAYTKLTFTADQMVALQSLARAQAGNESLTKHDAVVAFIITVLNRVATVPIRQIITILDYRGEKGVPGKYDPPGPWSVGNVIMQKYSDKLPEGHKASMGTYATMLRQNIRTSRDPEYIRRYVAIAKELRVRSTVTNRVQWWWTFEDSIGVNNLGKHSVKEMTFGYPGKERYYLFGNWERYLRIFPANPKKLADGTWRSYEGGVDVVFRLRKEIRVPFLKAAEEDLLRVMGCMEKL